MLLQWFSYLLCLVLVLAESVEFANGKSHSSDEKWYKNKNGWPYESIIVDQSGSGNFSSVQSAIDSVPSFNSHWVFIYIRTGIYREKLIIPYDKPYIVMKGGGRRRTQIVWNDHFTTEMKYFTDVGLLDFKTLFGITKADILKNVPFKVLLISSLLVVNLFMRIVQYKHLGMDS